MKNGIISVSLVVMLILGAGVIGCAAEVPETTEYNLTVSSTEGGLVTTPGEPGPYIYDEGEVVNLVAEAEEGYRFVNWTGDVSTITHVEYGETTITMNGNYEITANFEAIPPDKYSLTIRSTTGGSVSNPSLGTSTYDKGTVVNLVATPETGYQFIKWTGDVNTVANVEAATTTITMDDDYVITANFALNATEIRTWYDLNAIRDTLDDTYVLMNDLNSTTAGYTELASPAANGGKGWQPIGSVTSGTSTGHALEGINPFVGNLDGQQYKVESLFINRPDENGVGLFGLVGGTGVIQNLGVVSARVIGHGAVSILAGCNFGTVTNSCSTGKVTGTDQFIGGLVGFNYGTMGDSYFNGNVTGSGVGGLAGNSWSGVVSNSYYDYDEVLINWKKVITVGALFGDDFGQWLANNRHLDVRERLSQEGGYYSINNVSDFKQLLAFGQNSSLKFRLTSDLDLATEPGLYIPYLAGEFNGNGHKIMNLSFSFELVDSVGVFGCITRYGKVTQVGVENVNVSARSIVGGLVGGLAGGTVSNSYSMGRAAGWSCVGGLVGECSGTVNNSYSGCSTTGTWSVGGLIGWNHGPVSNSYSTGSVDGNGYVGGLVGQSGGTVSNCFWDMGTSGQATPGDGTGKTTAEMKNVATFSGAGWSIVAVFHPGTPNASYIWNIVDGGTYPFLSWQS